MKLLARMMAILAAAAVIVGITYGIGQSGLLQNTMPSGAERPAMTQDSTSTTSDTNSAETNTTAGAPADRPAGEEGAGGSTRGLLDVAKNLGVVAAMIVLISLVKFAIAKIRPKRGKGSGSKGKRPTATPTPIG